MKTVIEKITWLPFPEHRPAATGEYIVSVEYNRTRRMTCIQYSTYFNEWRFEGAPFTETVYAWAYKITPAEK